MKNKSYGYKCFRKNAAMCGEDGLMTVVIRTREEIDRHYQKPFDPENLMKRWSRLEYHRRSKANLYGVAAVGYGMGFLTAFYFFLMSLPELSQNLLVLVGLMLVFLAVLGLGLFLTISRVEKAYDDPYDHFILPYEKEVLAQKLEDEYGFHIHQDPPKAQAFPMGAMEFYENGPSIPDLEDGHGSVMEHPESFRRDFFQ